MEKSQKSSFFENLYRTPVLFCSGFLFIHEKRNGKTAAGSGDSADLHERGRRTQETGEPTMVSLTPDSRILWTYRPEWKLMPDNKDTVYVEFDGGKVTKVIKAAK